MDALLQGESPLHILLGDVASRSAVRDCWWLGGTRQHLSKRSSRFCCQAAIRVQLDSTASLAKHPWHYV